MPEYGEVSWVRLPTALKSQIQTMAEDEHRTLTAQIVILLEKALRQPQPEPQAQQPAPREKKGAK